MIWCYEKLNSMSFQVFHDVRLFSRFSMTGRNPVWASFIQIYGTSMKNRMNMKYKIKSSSRKKVISLIF